MVGFRTKLIKTKLGKLKLYVVIITIRLKALA